MTIKLLFLAGSARADSINKKLARAACSVASNNENVEATFIDLKDYSMPIYDGDLENEDGLPEQAINLKKLFIENDGVFIASPEYNSGYSALLKNMIDWLSRPHEENETSLIAFKGKTAGLAATSPGGLGGIRGLVPLRMLLGNIGMHVIPSQAAIGNGFKAFNEDGTLTDNGQKKMLQSVIDQLIITTQALKK